MQTYDIPWLSLVWVVLSLLPVFFFTGRLGLKVNRGIAWSMFRMVVQLLLLGIYLEYLFAWNNAVVNIAYLILMVAAASITSIRNTVLRWRKIYLPIFLSALGCFSVYLFFFNYFVVGLERLVDARYLIPLGGMLLGNSLKSNIVALNAFAKSIKESESVYFQQIGFGASPDEALQPFVRDSLKAALHPSIASTATIGLVSIPGIMTGQILAGLSPLLAIKYQIAIVIGIFANTFFGIVVQAHVLKKVMFNKQAVLRKELYK